jgi:hypothetical protein
MIPPPLVLVGQQRIAYRLIDWIWIVNKTYACGAAWIV